MEKGIHPSNVREVLGRHILADGLDIVFDLERSRGSRIYDAKAGDFYLDFFSCFATVPLGYNHPRLTTRETIQELGRAAVQKPSNSDAYTPEMAAFVDTFSRLGVPQSMPHMFLIEGGALAVENALKVSFDWKVRKNLAAGKGEKGSQVIHFEDAFHGRSGYTLSLTNTDPIKTDYFPKFDWPRISNAKCVFPLVGENLERVMAAEEEALNQIRTVLDAIGEDVACLIIEPIQCEGGDRHFRPEFHRALRRICDQYDILFIYDEVQTGFGMTGRMWAFEHFVEPDIVTFGKKSQVCGLIAGKRIDEVPDNVFKVSSRLNSTWGGNLVDMVRSRIHMEIFDEENTFNHVRAMGDILLGQIRQLQADNPDKVSNARGLGLLCALDLPDQETRNQLVRDLFQRRLIILGCGTRSIRFRTSLNIPEKDLREGLSIIRDAVRAL